MASDDGLTGNEFGRPPLPAEAGPDGRDREQADDVAAEDEGADPEGPAPVES